MAMNVGGGSGLSAEPNVTPLIDVLLVLLIIFMVIVPVTPKGLDALVPQPPKKQQQTPEQTIVVSIDGGANGMPSYKINQTDVAASDLENQLNKIYAIRAQKVMFVKGANTLDFQEVAHVIDIGHEVGVDHIGLITPKMEAGQ